MNGFRSRNNFTNRVIDLILDEPVMSAAIGVVASAVAVVEVFELVSFTGEQKAALGAFGLAILALAKAVRERVSPDA